MFGVSCRCNALFFGGFPSKSKFTCETFVLGRSCGLDDWSFSRWLHCLLTDSKPSASRLVGLLGFPAIHRKLPINGSSYPTNIFRLLATTRTSSGSPLAVESTHHWRWCWKDLRSWDANWLCDPVTHQSMLVTESSSIHFHAIWKSQWHPQFSWQTSNRDGFKPTHFW